MKTPYYSVVAIASFKSIMLCKSIFGKPCARNQFSNGENKKQIKPILRLNSRIGSTNVQVAYLKPLYWAL